MPVGAEARRRDRLAVLLGRTEVDVERIRARITAYVYGTILTLAAVLEVGPDDVRTGFALLILAVTTITTYVAHVLSYDIGGRVGRSTDEHRHSLREEVRDALPIGTSGILPSVPLLVGLLGWWPPMVCQLLAVGIVVLRLAATGGAVGRLTHRSAAFPWVSGLALAAAGAVVAILKVVLLH